MGHGLYNDLKDKETVLLFDVEEDVYEFCSRSIINPIFLHYMTSQLNWWKKQSRKFFPKLLYVVLHSKWIDVACLSETVQKYNDYAKSIKNDNNNEFDTIYNCDICVYSISDNTGNYDLCNISKYHCFTIAVLV